MGVWFSVYAQELCIHVEVRGHPQVPLLTFHREIGLICSAHSSLPCPPVPRLSSLLSPLIIAMLSLQKFSTGSQFTQVWRSELRSLHFHNGHLPTELPLPFQENFFLNIYSGWVRWISGKGSWCQAWSPEFNPCSSWWKQRTDYPTSCAMMYTHTK